MNNDGFDNQISTTVILPCDNTTPQITEGSEIFSCKSDKNNMINFKGVAIHNDKNSRIQVVVFSGEIAKALYEFLPSFSFINKGEKYYQTYPMIFKFLISAYEDITIRVGADKSGTTRLYFDCNIKSIPGE